MIHKRGMYSVLISGIQKKLYILKKSKKHQIILNGKFKIKKELMPLENEYLQVFFSLNFEFIGLLLFLLNKRFLLSYPQNYTAESHKKQSLL